VARPFLCDSQVHTAVGFISRFFKYLLCENEVQKLFIKTIVHDLLLLIFIPSCRQQTVSASDSVLKVTTLICSASCKASFFWGGGGGGF